MSKQFAKEQVDGGRGAQGGRFVLDCSQLGPTIYRHKYKQRAGTTNPPQCKIKKLNDSKRMLD